MGDIYDIKVSAKVGKQLKRLPLHIVLKLQMWIDEVGEHGILAVRKIPGYHDEPLKGRRMGQRSIRLNKSYRATYTVDENNQIEFIEVIEVNKHEY